MTSPTALDVDVVLPCLNEADALPWVLARIPHGWRALVVDNGSTDGSAELARELGALVVHEPRRGFGAACHAGLTAATADVVCFCDCDASLDPSLLSPFVGRLDDINQDGMEVVRELVTMVETYDLDAEVLTASVRSPRHVTEAALARSHIATVPLKVLSQMIHHPLTDKGIVQFRKDWEAAQVVHAGASAAEPARA